MRRELRCGPLRDGRRNGVGRAVYDWAAILSTCVFEPMVQQVGGRAGRWKLASSAVSNSEELDKLLTYWRFC